MGGYNSVCELMALGARSLIVPRVHPRREQLIRAERFQELGLVDCLHPDSLTPEKLGGWLRSTPPGPRRSRRQIDLGGLGRIPHYATQLLGDPRAAATQRSYGSARLPELPLFVEGEPCASVM